MPNLTTGNTRAGGLATWPARWSFLLLWSTGVALAVIDSPDSVFDPKTLVVFAAALVGALLLTTPTPGPLRPGPALALVPIALLVGMTSLAASPLSGETWGLTFGAYLVAFLIPRGNPRIGALGSALFIGCIIAWSGLHHLSQHQLADALGIPIGCVMGAVVWRLVLRSIVRRERMHRSQSERIFEDALARSAHDSRKDLGEIRTVVEPILTRLAAGDEIDERFRNDIVRLEAALRDRIRVPRAHNHLLIDQIERLRERDVAVVLLGEPNTDGDAISDDLATSLARLIASVESGKVTIRVLPDGRAAAATVVMPTASGVEQIVLADCGKILSRI